MPALPGSPGPPIRERDLLGGEAWRRLAERVDLPLLAVLAVALWLRIQGATDDGFWLDETTSLRDAAKPLAEILAGKGRPGHPPLYYLLLKAWTALFSTSETAVRLLSAISGTAAVGMTYALFRALHGRATGLAASILLALSFHHIVFSQEARNYALFGFLVVAAAYTLWRVLAEGGRRRWTAYVVTAVLMAYTHHQAYVVLFGLLAGAILAGTAGGVRSGAIKGALLANLIVVAAAVPSILLYMLGGFSEGAKREYGFWQPNVSWQGLVDVAAVWTPGGPLLARDSFLYTPNPPVVPWLPWLPVALLLPAVLLAIAWIFAPKRESPWDPPSPRPPPTLFHAAILYVGIGTFVVIATLRPIWHVRYVVVFLPFFLGGIAVVVAPLRSRYARAAVLAILVALSLPGLVKEKQVPGRTPWRETAAYLASKEGRTVYVIGPNSLRRPLGWYYKRPFEVVPDATRLVAAVCAAAERGPVLVVYCNAHGPPDPRHIGAAQLSGMLAPRGARRFGPLTVYEFAKKR